MCNPRTWIALILLVISSPALGYAQASRAGATFMIGGSTSPVILPDVAHDPVNDRYLVVSGNGFIEGQLLNSSGARIGAFVVAQGSLAGGYAQTPRVAWGAGVNNGAGGFLVTWHETVGPIAQVRGKLLAANGTPLTGDIVIATEAGAAGTGSNWTMGAAVAYSTTSHEFLITWMGGYFTTQDIRFNRVNTAGQVLQATAAITGGVDWERDPSVTYNPAMNEFYIVYAGYVDAGGFGYVSGQRIQAGTGAGIGGPTMFIQSAATMIPSVEYNPATGLYLVTWYNRTSASAAFYGASVHGASGAMVGGVRLMSAYYVAYDALDVAYNAATGDFLLVTHGAGSQNWEDAAVSIRADGTAVDNGFILTQTSDVRPLRSNPSGTEGNFNPRVTAGGAGRYLAATSSNFAAVHGQFAASSGSAPGPTPTPTPTPTTPDTRLYVDSPANSATVAGQLTVSGWAVDLNSTSGTGVDAVHAYAFPVTGGQMFLGAASFTQRLDVASYFGNSRFTNSGFALAASLPPGVYNVAVYARSTVTGTFNAVWTAQIRVTPPSNPLMSLDQPRAEWPSVSTSFWIRGWALDTSSFVGPGVDAVHVWAYPVLPTGYGAPIWAGAATVGTYRPDVASAFGNAQFATAGFEMVATLPPGVYDVVVLARSWIAGSFNNWRVVRVTTQ
ncbi:MAG TPA: hypothetical protein VFJ02_14990 [Vicinamibacterales bacterium]|nr:hypothetical protein [Vicinamibacterales bacterium]